jgi:hypothetical protein
LEQRLCICIFTEKYGLHLGKTAFVNLFYENNNSVYCQIIGRVETYELEKMWILSEILISFILSAIEAKTNKQYHLSSWTHSRQRFGNRNSLIKMRILSSYPLLSENLILKSSTFMRK